MINNILTLMLIFVFTSLSIAQQAHIEGDGKIDGKLDVTDTDLNTFIGRNAGVNNSGGTGNTSTGYEALSSNIGGDNNSAFGNQALNGNQNGHANTAIGVSSLFANSSGFQNTAIGALSLWANSSGQSNTAIGNESLLFNTGGTGNTGTGYRSLYSNTSGNFNTSLGYRSLSSTTGSSNTGVGAEALDVNTSGSNNTAIGAQSGPVTGQTNLTNAAVLGYQTLNTASNQVRIGNASVTSIGGYQAWSNVSDARFKREVRENVKGLDFILNLRPVTYQLDTESICDFLQYENEGKVSEQNTRQTGFIAQEVEQLMKELGIEFSGVDVPENEASHYGLRYAVFVVPLVKAIQEQQVMIKNLQKENAKNNKEIAELKTKY